MGGGNEGNEKEKKKKKKRDREGDETGKEGNREEFEKKRVMERGPSASPGSAAGLDGSGSAEREGLLTAMSSPEGEARSPVTTGEVGGDREAVNNTAQDCNFVADAFDNYLWSMEALVTEVESRSSKLAVHSCIRQLKELRVVVLGTMKAVGDHRDE